jgi:hypothetical protein
MSALTGFVDVISIGIRETIGNGTAEEAGSEKPVGQ